MKHLFITRLKCLLREKTLLFWTLLFPLVLSTLFYFAFSNMRADTKLEPIPVAVVDNAAYQKDSTFQKTLEEVGRIGENQLLKVTLATEESAKQLLEDGRVDAFLTCGDEIGMTVKKSGINQSILKSFLDEYRQTSQTLTKILTEHPEQAAGLLAGLGNSKNYVKEASLSEASPDPMLNYFYTVIAMVCLYGGYWGLRNTSDMQPNLSPMGARRSVAPMHKMKTILADQCAAILVQFSIILAVLAYLRVPLQVDFGSQWGYILLSCFTGCIFGVSMGTFIGCISQKKETFKISLLMGVSMTCSFLAGMMVGNMRDIIAHKAPFINYINPAALITDSFYVLYYYDNHNRFFLNLSILWAMSLVMWVVSYLKLRRQKYASL